MAACWNVCWREPDRLCRAARLYPAGQDVARQSTVLSEEGISHAAQALPVGIFRARAARRAILLEMNPAARSLLAHIDSPQPALADLFSDSLNLTRSANPANRM
jgi:hypothetical protein